MDVEVNNDYPPTPPPLQSSSPLNSPIGSVYSTPTGSSVQSHYATPSQRCTNTKRTRDRENKGPHEDPFEEKILHLLNKENQRDEDELFAASIVPQLKKLPEEERAILRLRINLLLFEAIYKKPFENDTFYKTTSIPAVNQSVFHSQSPYPVYQTGSLFAQQSVFPAYQSASLIARQPSPETVFTDISFLNK